MKCTYIVYHRSVRIPGFSATAKKGRKSATNLSNEERIEIILNTTKLFHATEHSMPEEDVMMLVDRSAFDHSVDWLIHKGSFTNYSRSYTRAR